MTKSLRNGITTGACAAAAARAATELLYHDTKPGEVTLVNPTGQLIRVPIHKLEKIPGGTRAVVIKDGGDDPDVTHGLPVVVEARPTKKGIQLRGGPGVGRVTKRGLAVAVGEPAINPVPRQMIREAVNSILPPNRGVELTVSVPGGELVARRTLNPRLGIVGGISILGTTGIVRPMSEEAFKDSLLPLLDVARAAGFNQVVLTPGQMGVRTAVNKYGFPADAVVEMSNFVGFMLENCVEKGFSGVLLWGHHGKLLKVAAGIFHTHSRIADARRETLASYAALMGADRTLIAHIMEAGTIESVVDLLAEHNLLGIYHQLASRASQRAMEYVHHRLLVGTVFLTLDGKILGWDHHAREIGRALGCRELK
ncbi:cobalt-precorrin 5B C1-methyltransferase [Desulfofundulus australicus DSM 11792]|uniref:Cobalt-precorrin-5B C(1)-methyltransferase n=1 Tax=Desulfofundulus australicus DSM 11792 TaxID=1121425 RepID=A0A1M5BUP4_9FIRM|nr:cobalt-precorrin-5B (C(1))-methyltransferase CbiD [Desulfofundulus australicus]SHF46283.1 cobalt-precorrin 5B C1-methyltransferase [Desulfofundulus australicus DSM 11792]